MSCREHPLSPTPTLTPFHSLSHSHSVIHPHLFHHYHTPSHTISHTTRHLDFAPADKRPRILPIVDLRAPMSIQTDPLESKVWPQNSVAFMPNRDRERGRLQTSRRCRVARCKPTHPESAHGGGKRPAVARRVAVCADKGEKIANEIAAAAAEQLRQRQRHARNVDHTHTHAHTHAHTHTHCRV
jgi:hypothetical protein